ncbi:glycosyltransferase [Leuconostoc citreum]
MYNVAVLMSSYNGEKYISHQIESILNQKGVNVTLYIRDDGSTDNTLKIIESFKSNVVTFKNRNVGLKNSFKSLIWDKNIEADYYAFADQDDVWDKNKLFSAIDSLSKLEGAGMYASNQRVVDSNLNFIKPLYGLEKFDLPFPTYKNFKQLFLHNNYFGNTIVLNSKTMQILREYRPNVMVVQHDTWVSIIVYMFGTIIFDPLMYSSYRQHEQNIVGGLTKPSSIIKKIQTLINKKPVYGILADSLIVGYKKRIRNNDLNWLVLVSKLPSLSSKIKLALDKNVKDRNLYKTLVLKALIILSKF